MVKGYEIAPDRYVLIEPGELETLQPKKTKTIEIEDFVELSEIDPVFYDHPYYLVPARVAPSPTACCSRRCARPARWRSRAW